ncbi:mucin-7-like [Procambarus clarkii]|uniref:mucin-7-like n=1 Tax=Procambarus clarkii TaxID=6728 RepID=UPI00374241FA
MDGHQTSQPAHWTNQHPLDSTPLAKRSLSDPICLAERLIRPDNLWFATKVNALYLANGLDPIIAPEARFTVSPSTTVSTTRTTTRTTSTQTPAPPKTQAAQTGTPTTPAPNSPPNTISADALANVLYTPASSTTNAPTVAATTTPPH